MAEFIHMGGYGLYIWGAYGAGLIVVGGLVAASLLRRRYLKQLERRLTEEP